ncbi:MAG: hypothetical protein F4Y60_13690 [Boseongicola sp. SB0664_bin_43]|uniref:Uncharacterized protein n=1 Tax=Boseongicola sp. SB0664_bin_43 TaxID=2604844 RepID=A0A6B0Y250_9RHOB|nr:hypothetical protein [Boseongicola sp. SB0664_bin_43]
MTPDPVLQEIDGITLTRYVPDRLIRKTAEQAEGDPGQLSFVHAVRVLRRLIINSDVLLPAGRPMQLSRSSKGTSSPGTAKAGSQTPGRR